MAKPKFTIEKINKKTQFGETDKELMSKTVDDGVYPLAMAKEIRIDRIKPDPNQPRKSMDQEKLEELISSVKEQGILQPIVVEYIDSEEYFLIVHGERRWKAALAAGLKTIPAIVRQLDSNTRLIHQIIENIQREDLNDIDRALALKSLKVNLGSPSWDTIAEKVGISKRRILQLIDTTKLPEGIQAAIRSGKLTEKHSRALKKLSEDEQERFAAAIQDNDLSAEETSNLVKIISSNPDFTIEKAIEEIRSHKTTKNENIINRSEKYSFEDNNIEKKLSEIYSILTKIDLDNIDQEKAATILRKIISQAELLLSKVKIT